MKQKLNYEAFYNKFIDHKDIFIYKPTKMLSGLFHIEVYANTQQAQNKIAEYINKYAVETHSNYSNPNYIGIIYSK